MEKKIKMEFGMKRIDLIAYVLRIISIENSSTSLK